MLLHSLFLKINHGFNYKYNTTKLQGVGNKPCHPPEHKHQSPVAIFPSSFFLNVLMFFHILVIRVNTQFGALLFLFHVISIFPVAA